MRLLLLPAIVLLLGACQGGDNQVLEGGAPATAEPSPSYAADVPEEFRAACGKPGTEVNTDRLRVVIKHADCDLTGVMILNQGRGVTVPEPGTGVSNSGGVDVVVDKETGDVTFTAEAEVAQY